MLSAFGVDHGEVSKGLISGVKNASKAYGQMVSGSHPTYGMAAERMATNAASRGNKAFQAGRFREKPSLRQKYTKAGKSQYAAGQAHGAAERERMGSHAPPIPSWMK